jgi:hypothetical protein
MRKKTNLNMILDNETNFITRNVICSRIVTFLNKNDKVNKGSKINI